MASRRVVPPSMSMSFVPPTLTQTLASQGDPSQGHASQGHGTGSQGGSGSSSAGGVGVGGHAAGASSQGADEAQARANHFRSVRSQFEEEIGRFMINGRCLYVLTKWAKTPSFSVSITDGARAWYGPVSEAMVSKICPPKMAVNEYLRVARDALCVQAPHDGKYRYEAEEAADGSLTFKWYIKGAIPYRGSAVLHEEATPKRIIATVVDTLLRSRSTLEDENYELVSANTLLFDQRDSALGALNKLAADKTLLEEELMRGFVKVLNGKKAKYRDLLAENESLTSRIAQLENDLAAAVASASTAPAAATATATAGAGAAACAPGSRSGSGSPPASPTSTAGSAAAAQPRFGVPVGTPKHKNDQARAVVALGNALDDLLPSSSRRAPSSSTVPTRKRRYRRSAASKPSAAAAAAVPPPEPERPAPPPKPQPRPKPPVQARTVVPASYSDESDDDDDGLDLDGHRAKRQKSLVKSSSTASDSVIKQVLEL